VTKLTEEDFDDMEHSPIEITVPSEYTPQEFTKEIIKRFNLGEK